MMHNALDRLEVELLSDLHPVSAPADLWDRVQSARVYKPSSRLRPRGFAWAMAMSLVVAAAGFLWVSSPVRQAQLAGDAELRCQNPAQLRAWVRAKTGLDLPFRAELPASIQLIGARRVASGVELDYRASNRDAALMVSRADGHATTVAHNRLGHGPLFTLACDRPADLQLACKLCHLD